MVHNPVVSQQPIGRFSMFTVTPNTVGVLYQANRAIRILQPGEGLNIDERLGRGGYEIYSIDAKPHTFAWRVNLQAKGLKDTFQVTATLTYKVVDPVRVISDDVRDTEAAITQLLQPRLRRISQRYALNHYEEADAALESEIAAHNYADEIGLELTRPCDVVITLTDADHARINTLNDLERAMRVPRKADHKDTLPSKDAAYLFEVQAAVTFRVESGKIDEMPSTSPDQCEQHLWSRILSAMRRTSQDYGITQWAQAQIAIQGALDGMIRDRGIAGFGVKVEAVDTFVSLEQQARAQYVELAQIEHARAKSDAQIEGMQKPNEFYTGLVQKGAWAVLAVAASKGEISADELYQRLNAEQDKQLRMQMDLLKALRADDAKSESVDAAASSNLLQHIVKEITIPPSGNALPGVGTSQSQLTVSPEPGSGEGSGV
mgnify:CR=1 FL=1